MWALLGGLSRCDRLLRFVSAGEASAADSAPTAMRDCPFLWAVLLF
jgi:hypothetical protein